MAVTRNGPILKLERVSKAFGGLKAVADCSLEVEGGKIVGLIGPNGAGKTTLFNLISGVLPCDGGRVYFKNEEITGLRPYQIARRGIGRTFQVTRVFAKMTVWENMLVASRAEGAEAKARMLLDLAGLWPLRDHYAAELSFGQQKLLDLARTMMLDPELVLLDEPAAGINPAMQNRILDLIHGLNRAGKSFMIIEHDMDVIMGHCDDVFALAAGRVIARGRPEEVGKNEEVLASYFGR